MTEQEPPAAPSERRRRGLAKMSEVYSFPVNDGPGDFFGMTVEHLFGDVWTRPALDVRSRRLLTIGAIVGVGRLEVLEIQFQSALDNGELTPEQVREVVIQLTHYTGWPSGAAIFNIAEQVIGRWEKAQAKAGAETPAEAPAAAAAEPEPTTTTTTDGDA